VFRSLVTRSGSTEGTRSPRAPRALPTIEELASPEATELGYRSLVAGLRSVLGQP
jgi:hypothetical protein